MENQMQDSITLQCRPKTVDMALVFILSLALSVILTSFVFSSQLGANGRDLFFVLSLIVSIISIRLFLNKKYQKEYIKTVEINNMGMRLLSQQDNMFLWNDIQRISYIYIPYMRNMYSDTCYLLTIYIETKNNQVKTYKCEMDKQYIDNIYHSVEILQQYCKKYNIELYDYDVNTDLSSINLIKNKIKNNPGKVSEGIDYVKEYQIYKTTRTKDILFLGIEIIAFFLASIFLGLFTFILYLSYAEIQNLLDKFGVISMWGFIFLIWVVLLLMIIKHKKMLSSYK
ncbi:MAG: hypothetical protein IJ187_06435 [Neisseriaceae bacterium]|nr:hypothetical protein [Neisseriaceae bacterium]